ncbi:dirigent protein 2-like [Rhodamnia argentea]|uniref:Dirigent protein n=1 Tax=Rhodamnia argentea TaxID=178133 RepID=A0ABM3GTU5_9MYRT|nr:dirigent protein 2-like [Rhodamnia argentea]
MVVEVGHGWLWTTLAVSHGRLARGLERAAHDSSMAVVGTILPIKVGSVNTSDSTGGKGVISQLQPISRTPWLTPTLIFFNLFQFFCFFNILITAKSETLFARKLSPSDQSGLKPKTLTHLSFYLHDILTAQHPTAVIVAQAAMTNQSLVGRAHGVYALSSLTEHILTMTINLVFTAGECNGSTLSVLEQNRILTQLRELTVVGGTGVFRRARGYIQVSTYSHDAKTKNDVIEYDVYAQQY